MSINLCHKVIINEVALYSIRMRLFILSMLAVLLFSLAMGGSSAGVAWVSGRRQIVDQLNSVTTLKEAEINAWLESLQTDIRVELYRDRAEERMLTLLQLETESSEFKNAYMEQHIRFENTILLRPVFEELFLMNRRGQIVIASPSEIEGEYRRSQTYFKAGLIQAGVHLQMFSLSGVSADWNTVVVVHPVQDEQGQVLGVLAGRASLDTLNQIMRERTGLGETGETYLVSSNNILLTDVRDAAYKTGQFFINTEGVNLAVAQHTSDYGWYVNYQDVPVVGVYRWLPRLQVVLLAEQHQDEAFRPIYVTIFINLIFMMVAILGVGILSMSVSRSIVVPIVKLAETAAQIASGDLSQVASVQREDEIGKLAKTFNHMTARLREMLEDEAQRAAALEQEIMERKQIEAALRESEDRYRHVSELTSDFTASVRVDEQGEWTAEWMTVAVTVITGYSFVELQTKGGLESIVHPDDRALVTRNMQAVLRGEAYVSEYRILTKSGETRWLRDYGYPEWDDMLDRVVHLYRAVQDITDRKQAEEGQHQLLQQVQAQARRMQQIIDTVPEGVILLDVERQVRQANPLGRQDLSMLAAVEEGEVLLKLGERPLDEFLTSPPKGLWHELPWEENVYQVLARSIETSATPAGWVLVIRDITQQREFEEHIQQQERLAAVGQLAAGIAHDFNNIMATVILYAQMIERSSTLSARDQRRITAIHQQAQHAAHLIQQILDFGRRAVLEMRELDLFALIKEHIDLLKRTIPENIQVDWTYDPGAYIIRGDPTRIRQMLMNLALNARDAMPKGGQLHIRLERQAFSSVHSVPVPDMEPGLWIKITVSDTGTGIPPDVLPRIFQPFFTTKEPGKGTGLGLAQAHGIVGVHGGYIDVETELGRGTTFVVYLPARVKTSAAAVSLSAEGHDLFTGKGETILLVEDSADTRQALVESLRLLGYRVLTAENGAQALAVLQQEAASIALVLSDVVMPEMGGVALFHNMRDRGYNMPVVLITGHPLDTKVKNLKGLAGWITKPPRLEILGETLANALEFN